MKKIIKLEAWRLKNNKNASIHYFEAGDHLKPFTEFEHLPQFDIEKEIEVEGEPKKPREMILTFCKNGLLEKVHHIKGFVPRRREPEEIKVREILPNTVTISREDLRNALGSLRHHFDFESFCKSLGL